MRKLLNTLYVTTPDAYLSKDGLNLVVSSQQKEIFRIPVMNLEAINTFGYQGASPGAMQLCVDNKVSLSFFTPHGRFIARIQGPVSGNVLLRNRQHTLIGFDNKTALHIASLMIAAKIYNSRVTLRRFVRDYPDNEAATHVKSVSDKLMQRCRLVRDAGTFDLIRGHEGEAAALYFSVFQHLILRNDSEFTFNERNRRPPVDPVNAMLSFGYSLLAIECAAALEGVGLDPALGFLHTMRPGRQSLALDLMEELRSPIVDRFVLSLINTRQISGSDFLIHHSPDNTLDTEPMPVLLTENGRKTFLAAWQNKKRSEITHPFLGEKISIGLLPHVQALLLARYLRGDIDDYPAFLAK